MDHLLLDTQWHCPSYVQSLQEKVQTHLKSFDGQTFLEWSRTQGYPESDRWHPLEQAHASAAEHWLPQVTAL
jgi:hypothetical protein